MYEISPHLSWHSVHSVLWNETEFTIAAVLWPRPQSYIQDILPCPAFCLRFGGLRSVIFPVVLVFEGSLDNHVSMVDDLHPSAKEFVDCPVILGDVADNLDAAEKLDVTGGVVMSVGDVLEMTWL